MEYKKEEMDGMISSIAARLALQFKPSQPDPPGSYSIPKRSNFEFAMICKNCGRRLRANDVFCSFCKIQVRCGICGNDLLPSDNFCDKCGARVGAGIEFGKMEERSELRAARRVLLILILLSLAFSLVLIYVAFG